MSAAPDARPGRPRRGPVARAYRILYWLFVVGVLGSISLSVTWYVLFATPDGEVSANPLPAAECRAALTARYHTLRSSAQRVIFTHAVPPTDAEAQWRAFIGPWRDDFVQVRARCKHEPALRHLAADVERMQVAWSTALGALVDVGRRPLARLPEALDPPP